MANDGVVNPAVYVKALKKERQAGRQEGRKEGKEGI
jgi:hypothetical protein